MYFASGRNVTGSPWPLSDGGGLDGTKVKAEGIIFLGFKDKDVHCPNDLSINLKIIFLFDFPYKRKNDFRNICVKFIHLTCGRTLRGAIISPIEHN